MKLVMPMSPKTNAQILCVIISLAGHPGVNNAFLVNSGDEEALLRNDVSVLEVRALARNAPHAFLCPTADSWSCDDRLFASIQHMHAFIAFDTMRKCKGHILESLGQQNFREVRRDVVALILATDLQQHFEVSHSLATTGS